jgi:hypothetical protein
MVQSQPVQKLVGPYFKNKAGVEVLNYNPSYSEGRGKRIMVQGQLGKSAKPYLNNNVKQKTFGRGLGGSSARTLA